MILKDLAGYVECRSKLKTPIAGGENEHGLHGFKALFESRAVDITQPDVGSCGGLTAMRHIAVLAHFGVEVNPHVWGSSVAQAASCSCSGQPSGRPSQPVCPPAYFGI